MDSDYIHLRPALRLAWEEGFTARSRFFRENPEAILQCFERGFLTLRADRETWTNFVRITAEGLQYLDPTNYAQTEDT